MSTKVRIFPLTQTLVRDILQTEQMFGVLNMMMNPSFYRTIHQDQSGKKPTPAITFVRRHLIKIAVTVIVAAVLFSSFLLMATSAATETPEQATAGETVVLVSSGDTLWDIANEYVNGQEDVRRLIFDIEKRNNLDSALIHPGQTIIIPVR
ncbi:LysM peptidoglycan-binding domain-containing protein [Paenibacillus protaetiae]|uniref:LysM peptidoglycan-binding domain-containing protein n=1 Tax=Paenibacillus protaetiae TaxID=2509456 RepID=A0A4P6ESF7_9BACL|nr:LysM peptidoglycan-binding domain-containing protein [Paenibacillus protaetiae]